jgi:hypothetical protein
MTNIDLFTPPLTLAQNHWLNRLLAMETARLHKVAFHNVFGTAEELRAIRLTIDDQVTRLTLRVMHDFPGFVPPPPTKGASDYEPYTENGSPALRCRDFRPENARDPA